MKKSPIIRIITGSAATATALVIATGCAATSTPTQAEPTPAVTKTGTVDIDPDLAEATRIIDAPKGNGAPDYRFSQKNIRLADGRVVTCVVYGTGATYSGGLSCDWDHAAKEAGK